MTYRRSMRAFAALAILAAAGAPRTARGQEQPAEAPGEQAPAPLPPAPAEPAPLITPAPPAVPPATVTPAAAPGTPSTPAPSAASPAASPLELTTLRLLRQKGLVSEAEYQAAIRDVAASIGDQAGDASTLVLGRWSTTLYGFLKADYICDSTQSFQDIAGNAQVERPAGSPPPPPFPPINYRGEHDRTTFSVRNSRFGFLMRAPETRGVRVLAQLEADFLGFLPPVGATVPLPQETRLPYETTESVVLTQPVLRLRHANVRLETPVVDVLFGQYWHLFGWQNVYQPGMVQAQGGPGHVYGRAPQLRVSRAFRTRAVQVEVAAAAVRPPARDSVFPDGQAGVRLAMLGWTGVHTGGATATGILPASVAVTGSFRELRVPELDPLPTRSVKLSTQSLAVNAWLPVIPARVRKGNALSVHGEFVHGNGISDLYTNLTGGVQMPAVANTTGLNPPPQYPQNVDNGLVVFDLEGNLHPVKWTTYLVGVQYTLPALDGRVWLAANYSRQVSPNVAGFTRPFELTLPDPQQTNYVSAGQVRKSLEFFDACLFWEIVPAVRVAGEYALYRDRYVDGVRATNHRVQLAGIFLFRALARARGPERDAGVLASAAFALEVAEALDPDARVRLAEADDVQRLRALASPLDLRHAGLEEAHVALAPRGHPRRRRAVLHEVLGDHAPPGELHAMADDDGVAVSEADLRRGLVGALERGRGLRARVRHLPRPASDDQAVALQAGDAVAVGTVQHQLGAGDLVAPETLLAAARGPRPEGTGRHVPRERAVGAEVEGPEPRGRAGVGREPEPERGLGDGVLGGAGLEGATAGGAGGEDRHESGTHAPRVSVARGARGARV